MGALRRQLSAMTAVPLNPFPSRPRNQWVCEAARAGMQRRPGDMSVVEGRTGGPSREELGVRLRHQRAHLLGAVTWVGGGSSRRLQVSKRSWLSWMFWSHGGMAGTRTCASRAPTTRTWPCMVVLQGQRRRGRRGRLHCQDHEQAHEEPEARAAGEWHPHRIRPKHSKHPHTGPHLSLTGTH